MLRLVLLLIAGFSTCLSSCAPAWERCTKQGGRWYEGSARLPLSERSGVCLQPFPDGGKPCRDGSECVSDFCECPPRDRSDSGPTSGPVPDGPSVSPEATGTCASFPPASGSGWHCLVVKGKRLEKGIIVD